MSVDSFVIDVIESLEELPTLNHQLWAEACSKLEMNGIDPSILDEFAVDDRTETEE